jgi:hypothetical protein
LGVPANAELIKAIVRGIIIAISAKSADPFSVDIRRNFAAPGEIRGCPPVFKRRNHPLPAMATLLRRGNTSSIENISEGERQGTSDHRILLRDAGIRASTMPALMFANGMDWLVSSRLAFIALAIGEAV